jgi:hypothetical protein
VGTKLSQNGADVHTRPVLNEDLDKHFERWYTGLKIGVEGKKKPVKLQMVA